MKNQEFCLLLISVIFSFSLTAQTVVKIPFVQPEPFTVQPESVFKSLEDTQSIEIGFETEIYGGSGQYTFTWLFNGTEVGINPTLFVFEKGVYTLTIDDGVGCESSVTYYIDTGVGVTESFQNQLIIYPNPSNGIFSIQSSSISNLDRIDVYSIDGVLRKSTAVFNKDLSQIRIDASALSAGNYLVVLNSQNKKITRIIVIK